MATLKTKRGPLKFKQQHLYLGIKKINKKIAKKNLLEVKDVLDREELYFGLMFGTLLGAIRDGDFITHDEDTDLFILSEDEEKLKSILFDLVKVGFDLIRFERFGLYSISKDGEYIDFYVMKSLRKGIRHSGGYYVLEKYLLDTTFIDFQGSRFRVPINSPEFFELYYGLNWRTPIQYMDYNLSHIKRMRLIIISRIKSMLPKYLYNKLLNVYHKKDNIHLINKCREYGIGF